MKNIEINRQDAIEALTETEAAILDVLVSKVQDYSAKKELQNIFKSKSSMIEEFAKQNGMEVIKMSIPVELPSLEDMMGVPTMKKEGIDPSIWNIAFDAAIDPQKYFGEKTAWNDIIKKHPEINNHPLVKLFFEKDK